jgi:hypothetical protein
MSLHRFTLDMRVSGVLLTAFALLLIAGPSGQGRQRHLLIFWVRIVARHESSGSCQSLREWKSSSRRALSCLPWTASGRKVAAPASRSQRLIRPENPTHHCGEAPTKLGEPI